MSAAILLVFERVLDLQVPTGPYCRIIRAKHPIIYNEIVQYVSIPFENSTSIYSRALDKIFALCVPHAYFESFYLACLELYNMLSLKFSTTCPELQRNNYTDAGGCMETSNSAWRNRIVKNEIRPQDTQKRVGGDGRGDFLQPPFSYVLH
jgi:hypothetical protein